MVTSRHSLPRPCDQDPGSPNQDIFPLFVKKKGAIDESVRRLCLVVADLQRHVMSQHGQSILLSPPESSLASPPPRTPSCLA